MPGTTHTLWEAHIADEKEFITLQTKADELKGSRFQGGELKPSIGHSQEAEKVKSKSNNEKPEAGEDSDDEFDEIEGGGCNVKSEFVCKDCKRPFKKEKRLSTHVRRHPNGSCQSLGIDWETMKCPHCGQHFTKQETAIVHLGKVHGIFQGKSRKNKGDFDCDICGKKIGYKDSLRDHKLRLHSEGDHVEQFKCKECNFSSPVRRSVTSHTREVHGREGLRMLKCPMCKHSSRWEARLLAHIMAVHQKIKDQVCGECGFATARKQNLTKHVREVHLKEKPYACALCDYASAQSNALTDHIEWGHEKPPKRERTCFICVKLLSLKRMLKSHLKKEHSGDMNCSECDFNASDPFVLNDHYEELHRT